MNYSYRFTGITIKAAKEIHETEITYQYITQLYNLMHTRWMQIPTSSLIHVNATQRNIQAQLTT